LEIVTTTNSLIISDLPHVIEDLAEFLGSVDRCPLEVQIEAKILQIALDDGFKMGVDWQYVTDEIENISDFTASGSFRVLSDDDERIAISGGDLAKDNYTALIEMLATQGETRILSSPSLMVLNNTEARILVGSTVPYKTVDTREEDGAIRTFEKVTEVDVGVKLYVTPQIGVDSMITLRIRPEVSSVTSYLENIPVVEKAEAETRVVVRSGVTVLIGGLVKQEERETLKGIPLLSQIPLIGSLFRSTSVQQINTELAILLTPTVVAGTDESSGIAELMLSPEKP